MWPKVQVSMHNARVCAALAACALLKWGATPAFILGSYLFGYTAGLHGLCFLHFLARDRIPMSTQGSKYGWGRVLEQPVCHLICVLMGLAGYQSIAMAVAGWLTLSAWHASRLRWRSLTRSMLEHSALVAWKDEAIYLPVTNASEAVVARVSSYRECFDLQCDLRNKGIPTLNVDWRTSMCGVAVSLLLRPATSSKELAVTLPCTAGMAVAAWPRLAVKVARKSFNYMATFCWVFDLSLLKTDPVTWRCFTQHASPEAVPSRLMEASLMQWMMTRSFANLVREDYGGLMARWLRKLPALLISFMPRPTAVTCVYLVFPARSSLHTLLAAFFLQQFIRWLVIQRRRHWLPGTVVTGIAAATAHTGVARTRAMYPGRQVGVDEDEVKTHWYAYARMLDVLESTGVIRGWTIGGGTLLAACRYGANTFDTGERLAHTDGDYDFIVYCAPGRTCDAKQAVSKHAAGYTCMARSGTTIVLLPGDSRFVLPEGAPTWMPAILGGGMTGDFTFVECDHEGCMVPPSEDAEDFGDLSSVANGVCAEPAYQLNLTNAKVLKMYDTDVRGTCDPLGLLAKWKYGAYGKLPTLWETYVKTAAYANDVIAGEFPLSLDECKKVRENNVSLRAAGYLMCPLPAAIDTSRFQSGPRVQAAPSLEEAEVPHAHVQNRVLALACVASASALAGFCGSTAGWAVAGMCVYLTRTMPGYALRITTRQVDEVACETEKVPLTPCQPSTVAVSFFGTCRGDLYPAKGFADDLEHCGVSVKRCLLQPIEGLEAALADYERGHHLQMLRLIGEHTAALRPLVAGCAAHVTSPHVGGGVCPVLPSAQYDPHVVYRPGSGDLFCDAMATGLGLMDKVPVSWGGRSEYARVHGPTLRTRVLQKRHEDRIGRTLVLWDARLTIEDISKAQEVYDSMALAYDRRFYGTVTLRPQDVFVDVGYDHVEALGGWGLVLHYGGVGTALAAAASGTPANSLTERVDRVTRPGRAYNESAEFSTLPESALLGLSTCSLAPISLRLPVIVSTLGLARFLAFTIVLLSNTLLRLPHHVEWLKVLLATLPHMRASVRGLTSMRLGLAGTVCALSIAYGGVADATASMLLLLIDACVVHSGFLNAAAPALTLIESGPCAVVIVFVSGWLMQQSAVSSFATSLPRAVTREDARHYPRPILVLKRIHVCFLHTAVLVNGIFYNPRVVWLGFFPYLKIAVGPVKDHQLDTFLMLDTGLDEVNEAIAVRCGGIGTYGMHNSCITASAEMLLDLPGKINVPTWLAIAVAFTLGFVPLGLASVFSAVAGPRLSQRWLRGALAFMEQTQEGDG